MLKKFQSRKFLTCIAGVVMGMCMVFGLDTGTVNTIAGAIVAASSAVMYIYTEGKIDAAAVEKITEAAETAGDAINEVEKIKE